MARVNVTDTSGQFVGWFDDEKAETFGEQREWDGHNHISCATRSQWHHEELIRTAGGRFVLHEYSQMQGRLPSMSFLSEKEAREWLLKQGHDAAVERLFGAIEEERGPGRPGRPAIGPTINLCVPEEILAQLDARAEQEGMSRSEIIRQIIEAGLKA